MRGRWRGRENEHTHCDRIYWKEELSVLLHIISEAKFKASGEKPDTPISTGVKTWVSSTGLLKITQIRAR